MNPSAHSTGKTTDGSPAPWHRHPIVWLMIAIPASAVVMGVVIVTLAVTSEGSVVRDDYYQAGRAINVDLQGSRQAAELGVVAEFHGSPDTGWMLRVQQHERFEARPAERVNVLLAHPASASRDLEFDLPASGHGVWRGEIAAVEGRWLLTIKPSDGGWLMRGEVDLQHHDAGMIEVRAAPLGPRGEAP